MTKTNQDPKESDRINDLPIPKCAKETLHSLSIEDLSQINKRSAAELFLYRGIGKKTIDTIEKECLKRGIDFYNYRRWATEQATLIVDMISSSATIPELLGALTPCISGRADERRDAWAQYGWMRDKVNTAFEKKCRAILPLGNVVDACKLLRNFTFHQRTCRGDRYPLIGGRSAFQKELASQILLAGTFEECLAVKRFFRSEYENRRFVETVLIRATCVDDLWRVALMAKRKHLDLWKQSIRSLLQLLEVQPTS